MGFATKGDTMVNVLSLHQTVNGDFVGVFNSVNDDTYAFTLSPVSLIVYHPEHQPMVYDVADNVAFNGTYGLDLAHDTLCNEISRVIAGEKPVNVPQ